MREAEVNRTGGQLDNAAATLERAIRIQPRNCTLWHELARVRLQQHQPGLAEDLAKKSNVLAQGNRALIQKNWAIIAEARRQRGDAQGAAEAEARVGR
jgi:predicted Zn-dependent protease